MIVKFSCFLFVCKDNYLIKYELLYNVVARGYRVEIKIAMILLHELFGFFGNLNVLICR